MMPELDGLILALAGASPERADIQSLGQELARRLNHPVVVSPSHDPVTGIRQLAGLGARRIVLMPLPLTLSQEDSQMAPFIKLASQRWPFLSFHLASPPGLLEWAEVIRTVALEAGGPGRRLLLKAASTGDPLADSNLARLAWLVGRQGDFEQVNAALDDAADDSALSLLWLESEEVLTHPRLIDCLLGHYNEAVKDDSLQRPAWSELAVNLNRAPQDEEAALRDLERRINEMLPSAYQGRYETVAPTSMGSASLLIEPDGQVAWDRMWTSFCDLALAGGPSHRGTLLEPVSAAEALADPQRYSKVVGEIERGIRLVTSLPVVPSLVAGWVGVRCDTEEMAIWMLRAIIVENVMCRREGEVLFLPAGPAFGLESEIKNVVTVIAKTFHYWTEHQRSARA